MKHQLYVDKIPGTSFKVKRSYVPMIMPFIAKNVNICVIFIGNILCSSSLQIPL